MAIDEAGWYDQLDRLAEEFAARIRGGERPSLEEYADRYPHIANEIRDLFPALVKVERAEEICRDWDDANHTHASTPPLSQVGDYRIVREIGRGGMGVVYEAEQVSLGRRVALKVLPWQVAQDRTMQARFRREARASARLHHTNIVPVFEVGQDGEVCYYAMQFIQGQSLDTVIDELRHLRSQSRMERGSRAALAHLEEAHQADSATHGDAARPQVVQSLLTGRFATGAAGAAAALASPSSSGVLDPVSPTVASASAVMPGGAQLSNVESRHRAFHRGVAHIGRQAASALAHAHARGIVHRDIKPSNLLLDTEGVVWVTDFGLAKVDDDNLTRTGDILGTLRYMAPERFRGQGDAQADLYSLGLTLYELLVLRPAFDSPDRLVLSEQIRTCDPPRPRLIDPRIPLDLETVVQKAIEKEPRARYHSAEALAEDLRRFLDDEAILARRVGATEQYLRWARRNPVIAVLGAVLTGVLFAATIASVVAAGRMAALATANERAARGEHEAKLTTQVALEQAEADGREADLQRDRAEGSLYMARIGLAENALRKNDPATAAKLLEKCRPDGGAPDRRGWEWHYLARWCRPELRTLRLPGDPPIFSLAVSPDGRILVAAGGNPYQYGPAHEADPATVNVYDLPALTLRHSLTGHWDKCHAVAFRPDGRRLATAATDGRVTIWDTETWRGLRTFDEDIEVPAGQPGRVKILVWSPDGRRLAVTIRDGVWIGDPETGATTARIVETFASLTWSPDGSRIAAASTRAREVRMWDAERGRPAGPALEAAGVVRRLFWAPPGRRLIGICEDGTRKTWDIATGRVLENKVIVPPLDEVESSLDGSFFVTGSDDGLLRVLDVATGRVTVTLFHGASSIKALALSPDGRRLFVGGVGVAGVKVFDPRRDPIGRVSPAYSQLSAMAFDERGETLRTISWELHGDGANVANYEFAGGGLRHGPRLAVSSRAGYPRGDFAFGPGARQLAAPRNGDGSTVGVWDTGDGREVAVLRSPGPVAALAYGAGGARLVTGALDGRRGHWEITIWDPATSRAVATIGAGARPIRAVALSADGRMVAAGGGDGQPGDSGWAGLWNALTGDSLINLDSTGSITALAFHPDGTRLAAADFGNQIFYLWDLVAGTTVQRPAPAAVSCLSFLPDGKRLASVGYDGQVHLADAQTGEELLVLRSAARGAGPFGFTPRLAFSRDGSRLAANGIAEVSFWESSTPAGPRPEPERAPVDVAGWLRRDRALSEQGDAAGATAAYLRARALDDGDPAPWIEHTLVLSRRGDSPRADEALIRAMDLMPDDAGRWADLGRCLERFGRTKESQTALAQARALAEQRLAALPDDEAAAAILAEVLPDAGPSRGWTTLQPLVMTSAAGATLIRQTDGSILVTGLNPVVDTYTVEAATVQSGITGLRLEVLSDPSLPHQGPGRSPSDGNFLLDAIRVSALPEHGAPAHVRLARASADYSDRTHAFRDVIGSIDDNPSTAWSIWPKIGRAHQAVFTVAVPIQTGDGMRLRVELVSGRTSYPQRTLGRFRLAVTNRPVPLFGLSLAKLKASRELDGLSRLGVAHYLRGDRVSAASILGRAAARSDASAVNRFLLALARHDLGQFHQARSACDSAVERLRNDCASEETRAVAAFALLTIRGLSVSAAESFVLDAAFPANPFVQ